MKEGAHTMKKALSFILVLAMLFSLLPVSVFAVDTAGSAETITVYFRNDWLWSEVYVHYWGGSASSSWPGIPMTKTGTAKYNDNGTLVDRDVYCAEIPADSTGIIFDNNQGNQTPNIETGIEDSAAWYIYWEGENKASKFDYIFKVIFDSDGGSAVDTQKVVNGKPATEPAAPTRDGYRFDGWYHGETLYDFSAAVTENLTLTAKWTPVPSEPETITVYFRNDWLWSEVYVHYWGGSSSSSWPGIPMTKNGTAEYNDNGTPVDRDVYSAQIPADSTGIIFNNNQGNQTPNIETGIADGAAWYIYWDGENKAGSFTYTPAGGEGGEGGSGTASYEATFHFANTKGWGAVNLYTWIGSETLSGSWPGMAVSRDADGFYTATVKYEADTPELNFIFSGGGAQTLDLKLDASAFADGKAEKWVLLSGLVDGKYAAEILDSGDGIAISPVVQDNTVTFRYKAPDAASVSVAGTFNSWNPEANPMVKNDYGVWSITVENISPAIHQYKFVVDGQWLVDPANTWVITEESGNQNSAFIISDPSQDINTVTINIHYTRADGDYENWNVYAWGADGLEKQYDLWDDGTGVASTSITLCGRAVQGLSFKVRKSVGSNLWAAEEGQIDVALDNIVSGTIDVYTGSGETRQVLGSDVVYDNKISDVQLNYTDNTIRIWTHMGAENPATAFALVKNGEVVSGTSVEAVDGAYVMTLPEDLTLDLVTLYQYQIIFSEQKNETYRDYGYAIGIDGVYATDKFAEEFTYDGSDLGFTYTPGSTTFKVWAPTAANVKVNLYATGSDWEEGAEDLDTFQMVRGEKGVWSATVTGDLKNTYYTYKVTVGGKTVEAVDPYARTTGVNGQRGMVIDLDSTDPATWSEIPTLNSYTDAVIYELHIKDFSYASSSGISEANRGKYLAFTETGTTLYGEGVYATGIDYLKNLGITHVHLLPFYDYGSVDEAGSDSQFNWGYDPVNYNVPEGSYSSNPYDGNVRVQEAKLMINALHENGIGVIMDVVYNHVYDATAFSFNQIVPGYFSRVDSNRSGCGNDTASEREMVRKYIVDSVLYWAEEYHMDGFRFDLVGLLDVQTINEVVEAVHAIRPDIIFYGEGWDMDSTNKEPGTEMAKQGNADKTPGFAYFSDNMRNLLGGNNGSSLGFVSGATGLESDLVSNFMANPWWTDNPLQVVQYASCHDNYTLIDKLIRSTGSSGLNANIIRMNNLTAAIYMTSQGIPFIHAGEELLRQKLDKNGNAVENSYNASADVNKLRWENLADEDYAATVAYYQGLIAFRKAHPALRLTTAEAISANIYTRNASGNLVSFWIDGRNVTDETHDSIYVIFNANTTAQTVELPAGSWDVCINGTTAGTATIKTVSGSVKVDGISAMVLVQETSTEEPSSDVAQKSDVALPGSFNGWNQSSFMDLTDTDGIVTTTLSLPAGTYEFKVKNGETWLGNNGTITDSTAGAENGWEMSGFAGNCKLVASGGAYTFIFNTNTNCLIVTYDPNGGNLGDPNEYYLWGYINGEDYAMDIQPGDYRFVDGKLTVTFQKDSSVAVKSGDSSKKFMTRGYLGMVPSATLYAVSDWRADGYDKLLVPGGTEVTFTLTVNENDTVTLGYETTISGFTDASGIQNGVTLHCWNWSFANITANMAKIAAQGYTAIQTSPIQPLKEATNLSSTSVGTHWWVYYQPVDFVITSDNGNALGTKADFEEMCRVAESYGIKVIVDVVANHLGNKEGNDLADAIPEYLRQDAYWHTTTTNITDWNDRYNMTQYCLDGLPDLNTGNADIQGFVLDFLKECVDAGADGFRFDMAKSIELPGETTADGSEFGSDFWPTVIGGIQEYAGGDLYIYGEVLDNPVVSVSEYTQYMSVTDNSWGNNLRNDIAGGTAALSAGYHKAAFPANLVIWAESHDTFATDNAALNSSGVSEAVINKTWALVAARADAMGLYLARPESTAQALGVASVTGWANPEVAAVNRFHNAFVGQSETIGNTDTLSYVVRGTTGIVIVNVTGANADVSLSVELDDGTYTDHISGSTFTVENGVLSGTIGQTGIAVVYEAKQPAAQIRDVYYDTLESAIESAQSGDTILLLTDTEIESLKLLGGVTLDLNGHTLTAGDVVAFAGNGIIDRVGGGLLKVDRNRILLQKDNPQLSIWNGEGYVFISCRKLDTETVLFPGGTGLTFLPYLDVEDYALLAQGTAISGVCLEVKVSWVGSNGLPASATFVYSDELMQCFFDSYDAETGRFGSAFTLTLTGSNAMRNLDFDIYFRSETGAELHCK